MPFICVEFDVIAVWLYTGKVVQSCGFVLCPNTSVNRYTQRGNLLTMFCFSYSFCFSTLQRAFCWCCNWIMAIYKERCNCVLPAAIRCHPAPEAPANGQRSGSGRTFDSTVTYSCNPGYILQGDKGLTCMANKRWSGSAPTCNRKLLGIRCSTLDIHIDINHPSGQCCCSMKTVGKFKSK